MIKHNMIYVPAIEDYHNLPISELELRQRAVETCLQLSGKNPDEVDISRDFLFSVHVAIHTSQTIH
jgi:hypothetical protein